MALTQTSFKPGESGNPNGRPKREWTMQSLIEEALEEEIELKNKLGQVTGKASIKKLIAKKLAHLAIQGDMVAIKEVNNRLDGMPVQKQEIEGEIKVPIVYIPKEEK